MYSTSVINRSKTISYANGKVVVAVSHVERSNQLYKPTKGRVLLHCITFVI
jgi:hypothetical protein